jgi:thiol-disulfide isomerase/thioredoxin
MTEEIRHKNVSQLSRWITLAAALAVLLFLVAACSSDGGSGDDAFFPDLDGQPSNSANDNSDIGGGGEMLFVYTGQAELGGEELTLAQAFELGKPVVLNFWAGLCPPCRQEMPDFEEVYNERKDEFLLLGVDVGPFTLLGEKDDALDLLEELQITYPTAYVDSDELMREYNVFGMPTTVFMTPDGDIVSQKNGFMSGEEMRERIQQMIDESQ